MFTADGAFKKPSFQLPASTADTSSVVLGSVKEKEANMSLKAQTCGCVQPKMGKVDIEYPGLHDTFFKLQTKPPVTCFGEMQVPALLSS
jgi:splicing factor 3B subunit 2